MTPTYHEGQRVRVTNEYGETLDWTILAINPASTGAQRLTLEAPPRFDGGMNARAQVYTNDPETHIATL